MSISLVFPKKVTQISKVPYTLGSRHKPDQYFKVPAATAKAFPHLHPDVRVRLTDHGEIYYGTNTADRGYPVSEHDTVFFDLLDALAGFHTGHSTQGVRMAWEQFAGVPFHLLLNCPLHQNIISPEATRILCADFLNVASDGSEEEFFAYLRTTGDTGALHRLYIRLKDAVLQCADADGAIRFL